jgi:hypothetical protein
MEEQQLLPATESKEKRPSLADSTMHSDIHWQWPECFFKPDGFHFL